MAAWSPTEPSATYTPAEVIRHIVGRIPVPPPPPAPPAEEKYVLGLDDVVSERVGPVSLSLRAGEVLGLVGLSGAGHMELGRAVIGALRFHDGSMRLFGKDFRPSSVPAAVAGRHRLRHQQPGRGRPGDATDDHREPVAQPGCPRSATLALPPQWGRAAQAQALVSNFGVRPANPDLIVSALSGGNQQKVILGRWLSTDAKVLVLEEPTAGVDVGAKHEIYTLLDLALARGVAVLLISTDYEEVAAGEPSRSRVQRWPGRPGHSARRAERTNPRGLRIWGCRMTRSGPRRRATGGSLIGTYGLLTLTIAIFVLFAVLLPSTFPTSTNITSILTNQSIPAILALGATIPIVTGRFDLSIGYGIGLTHVVVLWLVIDHGLSWPLAAVLAVSIGIAVGLLNGLLVEFAQIDSFIATLGTGSVLYALTGWITGGGRIVPGVHGLPSVFTDLTNASVFGLPITFWYVVALVAVLWLALEHLPLGRYLYVVGRNPRAAELVGIPRRRIVIYAFVGSGVVTAFAGVLLAAQQQIGDPSAGSSYLLPAFVGALLGSTTIKPGRANAVGTLVAVAVLAIGLSGLQQEGAAFWVTPLFNGLTLLAAVGLAGFAARRRQRAGTVVGAAARPPASAEASSAAETFAATPDPDWPDHSDPAQN